MTNRQHHLASTCSGRPCRALHCPFLSLSSLNPAPLPPSQHIDVVRHSRALLSSAAKTAYFVNLASLLEPQSGAIRPEAWRTLTARLAYLDRLVGPGHGLLFYLSRLPSQPPSSEVPAPQRRHRSGVA